MYNYRRKKILDNLFYYSKMFMLLFICLVIPVFGVFKYREFDYQKKQAKMISDFLERKGMYAVTMENNMTNLESISGFYNPEEDDVVIESSSGIYIPNQEKQENLGETPSNTPTTKPPTPVPTPQVIKNEYGTAEGDVLTLADEFRITYYCACKKCCGKWSYEVTGVMNKTASGTIPEAGRTIAVCKDQIPLGTIVIIDGHEYVAEDTGSAIKWNCIDIFCDSHQEALNGGVKKKTVSIKR